MSIKLIKKHRLTIIIVGLLLISSSALLVLLNKSAENQTTYSKCKEASGDITINCEVYESESNKLLFRCFEGGITGAQDVYVYENSITESDLNNYIKKHCNPKPTKQNIIKY